MAIAIKRLMLITRNVRFAIDVKRALEAMGEYSVKTIADLRNAMEELRDEPQHLVLLDTADLALAPEIMLEMIRSRRSDIAIVLAPDRPETRELARRCQAQGVVDIPVMARALLPVLDAALQSTVAEPLQQLDDTPPEPGEDTVTIESLVGDLFQDEPGLNYTRRRLQASLDLLNPRAAADASTEALELHVEPDGDSDTVRFRYIKTGEDGAADLDRLADALDETTVENSPAGATVKQLAQSLAADPSAAPISSEQTTDQQPAEARDLEDSAAFERMLNTVLDESTALENLTLESLFDTTRELPGALGTGVVPAWLRETEQFIREPSFLPPPLQERPPEPLPQLPTQEHRAETTMPNAMAQAPTDSQTAAESQAKPAALPHIHNNPTSADETVPAWTPLSSRDGDPALAQLALTMTSMMSELTADATVLARDNRIVAYSGELALASFRALRRAIADDWRAQTGQSRIRFVKLPHANLDYMLCTRETVGGHCLTLVFAGDKQLSDIRLQGERMLRALSAARTDESGSEDEAAPAPELDARQPFAFVWLVADPGLTLRQGLAEQLVFWLEVQLNSLDWRVQRLDVHQDFIYLKADAPARASPDALARTVMERSRVIACSEDRALPRDLWADAYLVLQPGRDMHERELRNFLRFARA